MKCPQCGADTSVGATRVKPDGTVQRTRICFNYHTYHTEERVVASPKQGRPARNQINKLESKS